MGSYATASSHSLYNPTLEHLALDTMWRNLDFALQDQHPDWTTLEAGIVTSILWLEYLREYGV